MNGLFSRLFLRVKEGSYKKSDSILRKDNLKSFQNIETYFSYLLLIRFYSLKRKHHFWPKSAIFWHVFELFRALSAIGSEFLFFQLVDLMNTVLLQKTACPYLFSFSTYDEKYAMRWPSDGPHGPRGEKFFYLKIFSKFFFFIFLFFSKKKLFLLFFSKKIFLSLWPRWANWEKIFNFFFHKFSFFFSKKKLFLLFFPKTFFFHFGLDGPPYIRKDHWRAMENY